MLKTVDVGLMANHLSAHEGIIARLTLYSRATQNGHLSQLLQQQIGMMENHVRVMNQLLKQHNVSLPPIPNAEQHTQNRLGMQNVNLAMDDRLLAFDAHFTAMAMANENFTSASSMKDPHVKQIHIEMALQQQQFAQQYEMMMDHYGWVTPPQATDAEIQTTDQQYNQYLSKNRQFTNMH